MSRITTTSRRLFLLLAAASAAASVTRRSKAMASETTTRTVRANGVEIVTDAFGDPSAPPVLLIMGAMASMLWWPEDFCRRIAASGRHVIRYDNRDTGLSTKFAPGKPPYSMDDMARDAVAVLDAYGIAKAHVVGMSLGGMIAQILALSAPGRVASLTLLSTTPIGLDLDLPPPSPTYMEHAATGENVDWSDRAQATGFIAGEARVIASTAHPHDAAKTLAFIERDYDRSGGYLSATNHFASCAMS
jgi:pimeloyl-ACP methyl ester carboxylesterase